MDGRIADGRERLDPARLAVAEQADARPVDLWEPSHERDLGLRVASKELDGSIGGGIARIRSAGLTDASLVVCEHRHAAEREIGGEDVELVANALPASVHHHRGGKRAAAGRKRERRRVDADAHLALAQRETHVVRSLPAEAGGIHDDGTVAARIAETGAHRQRRTDAVHRAGWKLGERRRQTVRLGDGHACACVGAVHAE